MQTKFDITSLTFFGFALILFLFNCGPRFAQENRRFQEEVAKYQNQEEPEEEEEEQDELEIKQE